MKSPFLTLCFGLCMVLAVPCLIGQKLPMMAMDPMRPNSTIDPTRPATSMLIVRLDVQEELKFTPTQKSQIMGARRMLMAEKAIKLRSIFEKMELLTPDERKQFAVAHPEYSFVNLAVPQGELESAYMKAITPPQLKRLSEIDLQFRGALSMSDPLVADALKLTVAQKSYVSFYIDKLRDSRGLVQKLFMQLVAPGKSLPVDTTLPGEGPMKFSKSIEAMKKDVQLARQKAEQVRVEMAGRALRMLSPAQLQWWKQLQGVNFVFKEQKLTPGVIRSTRSEFGQNQ